MLTEGAARFFLDLCKYVFVAFPGNDLAECDARRKTIDFLACQHLPRKLIKERETLAVGSVFAKPRYGMPHGGARDHSAGDGDEDLQARHALQEDFETARPVNEFAIRVRHEFGISFDAAARKDEERATAFQVTDCVAYHLHSSRYIIFARRKDRPFVDVRKMLKEGDVADDDLVIRALHVRGNEDRIHRGGMVRRDDQWTACWNIFYSTRGMGFDETRQEPARAGGESALGDDSVKSDAHFRGGARGSAKDQADDCPGAFGLRKREGFGQFEDEGIGKGLDFKGGHFIFSVVE